MVFAVVCVAGDRQFFYLNGRPVDLPKATKLLNETYRSLSSPAAASSKPMAVVDFRWGWGGLPRGRAGCTSRTSCFSNCNRHTVRLALQAAQGQL